MEGRNEAAVGIRHMAGAIARAAGIALSAVCYYGCNISLTEIETTSGIIHFF